MRLVSNAVALLAGCGVKITASRHFTALIAIATMVTTGLVTGNKPAMIAKRRANPIATSMEKPAPFRLIKGSSAISANPALTVKSG